MEEREGESKGEWADYNSIASLGFSFLTPKMESVIRLFFRANIGRVAAVSVFITLSSSEAPSTPPAQGECTIHASNEWRMTMSWLSQAVSLKCGSLLLPVASSPAEYKLPSQFAFCQVFLYLAVSALATRWHKRTIP